MKKCYVCREPATTREHVPPQSFFDEGNRKDLITVPSCEKHNNSNSDAVDYVRRIITSSVHINEAGHTVLIDKVFRSLDKKPGLIPKTFKDLIPVVFRSEETAAFKVDFSQIDSVMISVAHGIHFYHFRRSFTGNWKIYSTQYVSVDRNLGKRLETATKLLTQESALRSIVYETIVNENPAVFTAELYLENTNNMLFQFRFYEYFYIYAMSIPFYLCK